MKSFFIVMVFMYGFYGHACNLDGTGDFAPENGLNISFNSNSKNGITEEVFNEVIEEISAIYKPIIEAKGNPFRVERRWSDGKVNASASLDRRGRFVVTMYGGLARHELITRDGFATVLCHEIGHKLGGAPRRTEWYGSRTWASNEGQSDYFAILKCFKRVYGTHDNISYIEQLDIHPIVRKKCNSIHDNESEAALCIRSVIAAKSGADLLGTLSKTGLTSFDKHDPSVVTRTNHKHPHAQCRLDNYFSAALCDKDFNEDFDRKDPNKGACNRKDGDTQGLRSLCWFKPAN